MPSVYNIEMDILRYNTIKVGEKYNFMIANEENIPIYFRSDNSDIVAVNKKGVVTGKDKGVTVITAYNENLGFEQKCKITVIK